MSTFLCLRLRASHFNYTSVHLHSFTHCNKIQKSEKLSLNTFAQCTIHSNVLFWEQHHTVFVLLLWMVGDCTVVHFIDGLTPLNSSCRIQYSISGKINCDLWSENEIAQMNKPFDQRQKRGGRIHRTNCRISANDNLFSSHTTYGLIGNASIAIDIRT